jgi:hypothetical protein
MVKLLSMAKLLQTRQDFQDTSTPSTMASNAWLMLSLGTQDALATFLQVGARAPGAISTLATAMTQQFHYQIISRLLQTESLCTSRTPLVALQMDTVQPNVLR